MYQRGIVTLNEMGIVAVAAQQLGQLLPADPSQHRWIGNLEAIEMKDRKYGAITRGIKKLVGMPTGSKRAGFGFSVANDATDNQIRVVEGGAIGMGQRITEFAALMNRPRSFRRDMAWNAVRPGKLTEQPLQSVPAPLDRRIMLRVGAFEIAVRHDAGAAVTGANDIDHVQIVVFDQPVEVDIEEIQPRRRAPVTEQTGLDLCERLRRFEQRIVLQVDLPDGKVVRS